MNSCSVSEKVSQEWASYFGILWYSAFCRPFVFLIMVVLTLFRSRVNWYGSLVKCRKQWRLDEARFMRLLELKRLWLKINCFVSLAGCWFSIAAPLLSLIPLQTYWVETDFSRNWFKMPGFPEYLVSMGCVFDSSPFRQVVLHEYMLYCCCVVWFRHEYMLNMNTRTLSTGDII